MILSIRNPRYLLKWITISILIGTVAGSGAITFYLAIRLATNFFLGTLVGYLPPSAAGEGSTQILSFWGAVRPWFLPVVTCLGGLLSGIIVFWLAPEAEKGGQDPPIKAFHQNETIRTRVSLVKLIASATLIGSGGSAGREGPIAHIGASIGSAMGRLFHLNMQEQRLALIAGMAAGISAIFRAPLGGAILAVEILYQDGLAGEALLPTLVASTTSYCIFSLIFGWSPIFAFPENLSFTLPFQLLYYIPLGVFCGILGKLYASSIQQVGRLFQRFPLPNWSKPTIGGFFVGLIALPMPQILGTSYGWVQMSMGTDLLTLPFWVILLFPFAKILTTSLSIESGGSGGIFGPGMVIGGMGGALLWQLSYPLFPELPPLPAPFVIVGMTAFLGGIGHVPIAMIVMGAEMTGNFSLLPPAMIAVTMSCLLVGKQTLYRSQQETFTASSTHPLQYTFPLLSAFTVRQAMSRCTETLQDSQSIAIAANFFTQFNIHGTLVLSEQAQPLGTITKNDIAGIPGSQREQMLIAEVIHRRVQMLHIDETLDVALKTLTLHQLSWAPVIEHQTLSDRQNIVGILTLSQILQVYQQHVSVSHP